MKAISNIVEKMSEQTRALYERLQVKRKYHDVFMGPNNPVGKEVLHDLIRRTGVLKVEPSADALRTAYLEGRRSIGLELIGLCRLQNEADILKIAMDREEIQGEGGSERYFQKHFAGTEDRTS